MMLRFLSRLRKSVPFTEEFSLMGRWEVGDREPRLARLVMRERVDLGVDSR